MNETLFKKVRRLNFQPRRVAEVGVYFPETSNILLFIEQGCKADLFEADPVCVEKIEARFGTYDNVSIYPYAIFNQRTTLGFYRYGASTFMKDLEVSPALVNDNYQPDRADLFYVESKLFSDFDDGTIDLISIDVEGGEWFVLETMVSRPTVISLETHGRRYTNPHLDKIEQWMKENRYKLWYREKSDTVYIKENVKTGFFSRWF